MKLYWEQIPDIQAQIKQVCELIEDRFQIRNRDIQTALIELNQAGGKHLRPLFFFLFTRFGDQSQKDQEKLLKIAASIEILHMATLIHDDIIDDSPLRRGIATIQSQFGKDIAVYSGDLLFTLFFELIVETMVDSPYIIQNAQSMKKILMGELDQMRLYYNQEQTIEDYLQAISGKTAELFKLASEEGAYFSAASSDTVTLAGQIGYNIGMAFQILDDILDYTATQDDLHKPVLEDLANGVYSLPLLLAIKKSPLVFKELLAKKTNMKLSDKQEVAALVMQYNGVEEARQKALEFTDEAINLIQQLPENPSKKQLLKMTHYLLKRKL